MKNPPRALTQVNLKLLQAFLLLMANAAERWGVPVSECSTEPNRVLHKASGRATSVSSAMRRWPAPTWATRCAAAAATWR